MITSRKENEFREQKATKYETGEKCYIFLAMNTL